MEVFSLANSCLLKIIENKTPFHAALKELFKAAGKGVLFSIICNKQELASE